MEVRTTQPTPYLKKQHATAFNVNVIIRILTVLQETGRINRTNLAGKTGLNYNKCIRYVNLLHSLEWIKIVSNDGFFVTITESGTDVIRRFSNFMS